jgi:hypothetical protein
MAAYKSLVQGLRKAEQELKRQLDGIRQAISTLEFGGAASPPSPRLIRRRRKRGRPANAGAVKRRKLSAKARKAISDAQKKRWAKVKAKQNG